MNDDDLDMYDEDENSAGYYNNDDYDPGDFEPTRISVVDQRGRPVGVQVQGGGINDMLPPYPEAGGYSNVRRRSRF